MNCKYEKMVALDYNMSVWFQKEHIYNQKDIAEFFDNISQCGVTTVYWRTSCLGRVSYNSKVQKHIYDIDWDDYMANADEKEKERFFTDRLAVTEKHRYIMEKYDPFEIAVGEARRVGVKIYAWITIYDDYFPGFHGNFTIDGVCLAESKEGLKMRGVLSYAWEEARKRRLSEIEELINYNSDGIYMCTKSHSQHTEPAREIDTYGYEKPVADEFMKRYGVDICKTDDFNREAWHSLKGEFFTTFLREAAEKIHEKGQRLSVGQMLDKYHYFRAPTLSDNHVYRYEIQWRTWAKEGIVDELIVGNGQRIWQKDPLWIHDEIPWDKDTEQAGLLIDKIYPENERYNMKIYVWSSWTHLNSPESKQRTEEMLEKVKYACQNTSADGCLLHEADAYEAASEYKLIKDL